MLKLKTEEETKREELTFKINICKNSFRFEEMLIHLEVLIKTYNLLNKKERAFLELPIKAIIQRFQTKLLKLTNLEAYKKEQLNKIKSEKGTKSEEFNLQLKLLDFIVNQSLIYKNEKKQFCEKSLKLIDLLISNLTLEEDVSINTN